MNLQIALVALGIVVVVAIYLLSRWQNPAGKSRSHKRNSDSIQEPSFGTDAPEFDRDTASDSVETDELRSDFHAGQPDSEFSLNQQDEIPVLEMRVDSGVAMEQGDQPSTHEPSNIDPESSIESDLMPSIDSPEKVESGEEGSGESNDSDVSKSRQQIESGESVFTDPEQTDPEQSNNARDSFTKVVDSESSSKTPSLAPYLGPLNRIKSKLQQKLDSVKSERENSHYSDSVQSEEDPASESEMSTGRPDSSGAHDQTLREHAINSSSKGDDNLVPETVPEIIIEGNKDPSFDPVLTPSVTGKSVDPKKLLAGNDLNSDSPSSTDPDKLPSQPAEGFEKLSQIDYYVKLNGDRDVSRESVLAIYRESASGISQKHSIYGLLLPDKVWRNLEDEPEESRFGDLVITMQLVDQRGPVSEQEMTRFSTLVMNLSESTGRGFAFMAPIENAQQQALAIDRFRNKFDSIFVVNIRPVDDEMFEGAAIERCASQIGLIADQNKFYVRNKPVGKQQKVCLYSLANMSDSGEFDLDNMRAVRTRGVTFFTRPAVNVSPGAVFAEMVDAAKAFASRIKGEVIAPGHESLSMDDVEVIRRSIEKVATEMKECGIPPGSDVATRLF